MTSKPFFWWVYSWNIFWGNEWSVTSSNANVTVFGTMYS